jgi:hypothetical protein
MGVLISSLFTVASSYVSLYAQAQETYPGNIFASSNQAQLHELLLKATEENGQINSVPGFSLDLTNVISIPANSKLDIFTTENALSINEAKVQSNTDSIVNLVKQGQNSFSLTGVSPGVYTVDIITQKGNSRAAYEGILVLGQEPTNPQTRTVIEQQIIKEEEDDGEDEDDDNGNGGNCDLSYPGVCIPRYPPDLDCGEVRYTDFKVLPPDRHDFDREGNGIGCQTNGGDDEDDNPRDNPDCWYGEIYVCDESGNCDSENFDCITDCADGSSVTTGEECPGDDDSDEPSGDDDTEEGGCQPEDDFCEPGCESPTMDCIDDVNVGDDGEDSVSDEDEEEEESIDEEEEESIDEEEEEFFEEDTGAADEE